ncbi:hypothetical protein N7489_007010 [Penicillium chrysogenum]|uniref:uncharacterized protein n=1 Tax=Penicillium chrysogenum TaxID=5076 RepID=UPI0024DF0D89|nr:uncharacterized protein N7489_007010 [Penicillium chrysogenum]KAJ5236919.1 hypothetical protein N7489_007010 [Penicillium chrysogenum]
MPGRKVEDGPPLVSSTSLVALTTRTASAINARRPPSLLVLETILADSRILTDSNIDPALFNIDEETDRLLLSSDSGTPAYSVESFVKHYSRINVVRYDHTKRVGGIVNGLEDDIRDLIRGNSRDKLTYYKYRYGKTLNYSY